MSNVGLEGSRVASRVVSPHALNDGVGSHHIVSIQKQKVHQSKFCWGEARSSSVPHELLSLRVESQTADRQLLSTKVLHARRCAAAQDRVDPRQQDAWAERLGHVIVCADCEALRHVFFSGPRSQHDNGRAEVAARNLANFKSVAVWDVRIQNNKVRQLSTPSIQSHSAIVDLDDLKPLPRERKAKELQQISVVIDNQDLAQVFATSLT
jgi:hypothetical protein